MLGLYDSFSNIYYPPTNGVTVCKFNNNNTTVDNNPAITVAAAPMTNLLLDSDAAVNVDMRQYKRIRMFLHAEEGSTPGLSDGDIVGFIRMGNDLTQNYYQIEIPLRKSSNNTLEL